MPAFTAKNIERVAYVRLVNNLSKTWELRLRKSNRASRSLVIHIEVPRRRGEPDEAKRARVEEAILLARPFLHPSIKIAFPWRERRA